MEFLEVRFFIYVSYRKLGCGKLGYRDFGLVFFSGFIGLFF